MLVMQDSAGLKVPTAMLNELWEQLLIDNGECWGKIISSSMHPVIKRGEQVLVERALVGKVRFADIIVFKRNGQLIIHRVLGKHNFREESHFLEKGDATLLAGFVPVEKVIGRVRAIKKSHRTIQTISGRGRILQLVLAFISYTSLKLWAVLEFCFTYGRRTTYRPRYAAAYNRLFSLVQKLILLHL